MTLQQTLQANTNRTRELFAKLEETSDQAVKTRENLFEELSRELRFHADIEQKDLLPALRSDEKTKGLAADAAKLNQEVRAKVAELEALPKNDAGFKPGLVELRKLFQRQLREEKNELVPALSPEKAEKLIDKVEAKRARAEDEQRALDEARKAEAKAEADAAREVEARQRAAADAADAARKSARELSKSAADAVREGAETVRENVETVRDTSEKAAAGLADVARRAREEAETAVQRASDETKDAIASYRETARERGADLKAIFDSVRSLSNVNSELRRLVFNSLMQSGRDSIESTKTYLRNPLRADQAQREYVAAMSHNLLQSTKEFLNIVLTATGAARHPIDQRLRAS